MLWFLMKIIAYGFEAVIMMFLTLMMIGIVHEKKPEWIEFIFTKIFLIEDDE